MDSDGSKEDSSVDSGTETSRSLYPEVRRESLIIPKKVSLPTREAMDNYLEVNYFKLLDLENENASRVFYDIYIMSWLISNTSNTLSHRYTIQNNTHLTHLFVILQKFKKNMRD